MEYINEIKKFWEENAVNNKISGMKFKKFTNSNSNILDELNKILSNNQHLKTIFNVCLFLVNDWPFDKFKCKTCNKLLKIKSLNFMSDYCSIKCAANDPELQKRKSETIASDPDYWKKRQEKIIKTNFERYGTKAPAQNKDVAQKMKDTIAKDPNHWKNRNEKTKQTCMERYGVKNPYNIKEIQNKSIATKLAKQYDDFKYFDNFTIPMFTKEEWMKNEYKDYLWKCVKCGNEFYVKREHGFVVTVNFPKCKKCIPNRMYLNE